MSDEPRIPPPWIAFPYTDWRCAAGQAAFYLWHWTSWFRELDASSLNDYKSQYPEPAGWAGFYKAQPLILKVVDEPDEQDFLIEEFYEEAVSIDESGGEGRCFRPLDRLVILLLREAIAQRCDGIEICDRDPRVHYLRGNETHSWTPMPSRIFHALKLRLAWMCGIEECRDISTTLLPDRLPQAQARAEGLGKLKISVVFGDASVRLTILDVDKGSSNRTP